MPDAAIFDPAAAGQTPTFFWSYREGRQQNGPYTYSSIHYFWTATRLETTSRSTATNVASYDWTGLAATQHRLDVSLATGSWSWIWKRTVETATLRDGACSWWWWLKCCSSLHCRWTSLMILGLGSVTAGWSQKNAKNSVIVSHLAGYRSIRGRRIFALHPGPHHRCKKTLFKLFIFVTFLTFFKRFFYFDRVFFYFILLLTSFGSRNSAV